DGRELRRRRGELVPRRRVDRGLVRELGGEHSQERVAVERAAGGGRDEAAGRGVGRGSGRGRRGHRSQGLADPLLAGGGGSGRGSGGRRGAGGRRSGANPGRFPWAAVGGLAAFVALAEGEVHGGAVVDRKSTRLKSSHVKTAY